MTDLFTPLAAARPDAPSKGSEIATVKNRPATPHDEAPAPRSYPFEICAVCGRWGAFGFSRFKNHTPAERYACSHHQAEVAKMGVRRSP